MNGPMAGRDLPVVDLHTHPSLKTYLFFRSFWKRHRPPGFMFPPCMRTDLDALMAGGVAAFLSAVYVVEQTILQDAPPLRWLQHLVPRLKRTLNDPPDEMAWLNLDLIEAQIAETRRRRGPVIEIAKGRGDLERLLSEGTLCMLHSLEGAHHLNGDLDNVQRFFDRGVCHLILPHFYENPACGCVDPIPSGLFLRKFGWMNWPRDLDTGLTDWGRELLDRMWSLGMIADLTHATPRCRQEAYRHAGERGRPRPIIMSHVGVHALAPYPMNPGPEDIRAIAETGGVVGIIFMRFWLSHPEQPEAAPLILKTIDHLVEHGGDDCVAFGSDFDGFTDVPRDFKSPRDYNRLRTLLSDRYGHARAEKFLSGNALRVLRTGWGKE